MQLNLQGRHDALYVTVFCGIIRCNAEIGMKCVGRGPRRVAMKVQISSRETHGHFHIFVLRRSY